MLASFPLFSLDPSERVSNAGRRTRPGVSPHVGHPSASGRQTRGSAVQPDVLVALVPRAGVVDENGDRDAIDPCLGGEDGRLLREESSLRQ